MIDVYSLLSPLEIAFVEAKALGQSNTEAYISALEQLGRTCNRTSASSNSHKLFKKLEEHINEKIRENVWGKKKASIEQKLEYLEKTEEFNEKREKVRESPASLDEIIIAKNPVIFNSLISLGIVKCLFNSVVLSQDKKNIESADVNLGAWATMPFVKDLVGRNMLNKDMFEVKTRGIKSKDSTSINVQLNNNVG